MIGELNIPVCVCGLVMRELKKSGIFFCPNDDAVQPGEYCTECTSLGVCNHGRGRVPTIRDTKFELGWKRRLGDLPSQNKK